MARADAGLRETFTEGLSAVLDRMADQRGGRPAALAAMSQMLGALVLSRAVADEALSREILDAAKDALTGDN